MSSFDAHGNGVKLLRFSCQFECLASVGFHSYSDETTLHISIWKKRGAAGLLAFETSLRHHEAPVELVKFVDSKRQLISLDTSGTFKVYSSVLLTPTSEPWECLQSFQAAAAASPPMSTLSNRIFSCFVVPETADSDAVLVTAGRRVTFYDLCEVKEREEVFLAHYCHSLNLLVGVTISKLLFWKADTGKLWKTFEYAAILTTSNSATGADPTASNNKNIGGDLETTPRTITAVCMDDRERKVILGDDAGSLKVINAVNGNVMKELDPHSQAIASICYVLHGKRVISISIDSSLHIYDENNPLGFYVSFGPGSHAQSVLLQSLRFLPETSVPVVHHEHHQYHQPSQPHHRRRTHKRYLQSEPELDESTSTNYTMHFGTQPEKFEIVKSVGNQELNRVAVLVLGSRGESFIQVWSFDMSHTQGTCVAPRLDEELTCLNFFGSSADIVGGTASGKVLLWRVSKDDPGYQYVTGIQAFGGLVCITVFNSVELPPLVL